MSTNQLSLSAAERIQILVSAQISDKTFAQNHVSTCVALEMLVDSKRTVYKPLDGMKVISFQNQLVCPSST